MVRECCPHHPPTLACPLSWWRVQLNGLFRTQLADGIMGMDNGDSFFWKQMFDANRIKEKKFSL
eukprot:scaffold65336_cov58-Attheya_sp.AAC.2